MKTTIRLDEQDRHMLEELAKADQRDNSTMIRVLIRQAYQHLQGAVVEHPSPTQSQSHTPTSPQQQADDETQE